MFLERFWNHFNAQMASDKKVNQGSEDIVNALFIGQPDEPVSVERVRYPFNPVEGKMNAFCLADRCHLGVQFLRAFPTTKLLDAIFPAAHTFLRHLWIELEGEPAEPDLVLMDGNGFIQSPLANEAPGADHVGDHGDGENHERIPFSRIEYIVLAGLRGVDAVAAKTVK